MVCVSYEYINTQNIPFVCLHYSFIDLIMLSNTPAMPMTCLQVTHKSSGFFTFSSHEKYISYKRQPVSFAVRSVIYAEV